MYYIYCSKKKSLKYTIYNSFLIKKIRAWRELNTLPADLQSDALPMSYRPMYDINNVT